VSGLQTENPKGFGLIQRDRDFDHYQDLETQAQRRPSVWIAPDGNWDAGRVEVVEIPTSADINDNIVAYWVPKQVAQVGQPFGFGYVMHWYGEDASRPPGGRVYATRRDAGTVQGAQRIVIDFSGGKLQSIPAERVLRGVVTVVGGGDAAELLDQHVIKNPEIGGWRLSFHIRPKTRDAIELRAFLEEGGEVLTETWSYQILP
jgi:glucans biosynthesis protein